MKPDWKDAPEWANFLARDEGGTWFWYEKQPHRKAYYWTSVGVGSVEAEENYRPWEESLEYRPELPRGGLLEPQRIVCAAVLFGIHNAETAELLGTKVVAGPRHFDAIMNSQVKDLKLRYAADGLTMKQQSQGFVDQFCKYYTREEAWVIAKENGQIIRRVGGDEGKLFSENLY